MRALALALALTAAAAPAQRLVDLELTRTERLYGSSPSGFTALGNKVVFQASNRRGSEPWVSDGTDGGTALLLDTFPGEASGGFQPISVLEGRLLFLAQAPEGAALYSTDGTRAGTTRLATLAPGRSATVGPSVVLPQRVVFSVLLPFPNRSQRVLSTDGTSQGTLELGVLPTLTATSAAAVGSTALLTAYGSSGTELYTTDGLQPLALLRTFPTAVLASVSMGGAALLLEENAVYGQAPTLWRSDGTAAGTAPVKVLSPGFVRFTSSSSGLAVFTIESNPFGSCTATLWRSDGSAAGTFPLALPQVTLPCGAVSVPVGGQLLARGSTVATGSEPFVIDPLAATTSLLVDIRPGTTSSNPSSVGLGGALAFFTAEAGGGGRGLWSTDGTVAGTQLLRPAMPGTSFPVLYSAGVVNGLGYLGLWPGPNDCWDLWVSDGSPEGTRRPRPLRPGTDPSSPVFLGRAGDLGLAATAQGRLFAIDVPKGSAVSVLESLDGGLGVVGPAVAVFQRAVFRRATAGGLEPWVSDGTREGTRPLTALPRRAIQASAPVALGTAAFFSADDGLSGSELWATDGTAEGTARVADVRPGPSGSAITELVPGVGAVFFAADDGVSGAEVWRSDGTDAGTLRLADLAPGPSSAFPRGLLPLGTGVVFTATVTPSGGQRLCVSDGTGAGTRCPVSSGAGAEGTFPQVLATAGPVALFSALVPSQGRELYALHPDAGVVLLETSPGAAARAVLEATQTADTAFLALVADGGTELLATNGSPLGTRSLGLFLQLSNLRPVGPRVYFSANGDAGSGAELWSSDGTPAGTQLAAELAPDALPSRPGPVEWVGNALLVAATDEDGDVEPFRVALPAQLDNTAPAIEAFLEGPQSDAGWFVGDVAVRFEVRDPGSPVQRSEGCEPLMVTADTPGRTLRCAATSSGGESQLTVTLRRDATAPALRCPDAGALTSPDGGAVAYAVVVTATDAVDPNPTVTVRAPASGLFAVGVTPVSATAVDQAGNTASCAFEVRVDPAGTLAPQPTPPPPPPSCGCGAFGAGPSALGLLAALLTARRRAASTRP